MADRKRIPTPLAHRWRRFRYSVMPFLTFIILLGLTLWLWDRHTTTSNAVGGVEVVRVDVSATSDGVLSQIPGVQYTLFDSVLKGQVLGRLDDSALRLSISILRLEMDEFISQISASEAEMELTISQMAQGELKERTRLAWEYERRRATVADRRVDLESERMTYEGLVTQLNLVEPLGVDRLFPLIELEALKTLRAASKARRDELAKVFDEEVLQRERAKKLFQTYKKVDLPEVERVLAPLRAALKTQEARIDEIVHQIDSLNLKSPISGTIAAVYCWPGQNVLAGDPVVTVASDHGRYIISYLRQYQNIIPAAGDTVYLKQRDGKGRPVAASVDRVGSQYELVPANLLQDGRMIEYGLPVRIGLPKGISDRPGELVDVTFPPRSG
ncbi:MAG: multidrug resistance efflux pump [Pirellulaceae bacterium]|jgi:multidrug resistance efflux pump